MTGHRHGDGPFIALEQVSYAYPTHSQTPALSGIDLKVLSGQYLLICGGSGSGKSTLVRTFNGLIPHFYGGRLQGRVTIDDRQTTQTSVAELFHQVGMVFQNPQAQLFNRTVAREIIFGMESLGLGRKEMQSRLQVVAAEMELADLLERNPQSLSGGEQQWVAIASILALRPRIVVLDEPMANLDAVHIQRLQGLLKRLRSQGIGVVVCEHRMVPTLPDADLLVAIQNGQKLLAGTPDQAVADPRWPIRDIEPPLALRIGRQLGFKPLPRDMQTLAAMLSRQSGTNLIDLSQLDIAALFPPHTGEARIDSTPPAGQPVITAQNLTYCINGRRILNNINFTLHAGQCVALVGANGAGKTTLIKCINGLLKPSAGRIDILGRSTAHLRAWQAAATVGTAFQNPNSQFFKLTVEEEILAGPIAQQRRDDGWIEELVNIFGLKHQLGRAPFKLSGGEKKRVAFAAALAAKPQVLVLDEPTAGQDSAFRRALIQCLQGLSRQGTAVLVVTHALNFSEALTDRWLVMAEGELIADGRPHAIMADKQIMARAGLAPTETYLWKQINPSAA